MDATSSFRRMLLDGGRACRGGPETSHFGKLSGSSFARLAELEFGWCSSFIPSSCSVVRAVHLSEFQSFELQLLEFQVQVELEFEPELEFGIELEFELEAELEFEKPKCEREFRRKKTRRCGRLSGQICRPIRAQRRASLPPTGRRLGPAGKAPGAGKAPSSCWRGTGELPAVGELAGCTVWVAVWATVWATARGAA